MNPVIRSGICTGTGLDFVRSGILGKKRRFCPVRYGPVRYYTVPYASMIVTSSRLGISARCLRDGETPLQIFPFDVHTCNLTFGSFGYEDFEFIYKWTDDKIFIETEGSIKRAFDIDSARQSFEVKNEFKLYNISYAEQTLVTINGRRSMLVVCFHVKRQLGYFIIQTRNGASQSFFQK